MGFEGEFFLFRIRMSLMMREIQEESQGLCTLKEGGLETGPLLEGCSSFMYIYSGQSHHPWKYKHSATHHISPGIPTGFTHTSTANYLLFKAVFSWHLYVRRDFQPGLWILEQQSEEQRSGSH